MAMTLNYQMLARRFITVPLIIILIFGSCLYLLGDLLATMKNEVATAQTNTHLLAQSLASKNSTLVSEQVKDLLNRSPCYESIMYYALTDEQPLPNDNIPTTALLFQPYVGIHEPVIENFGKISSHRPTATGEDVSVAKGYINLTLNLSKLRWQWLKQSLPIILTVLLVWLITLSLVLKRLRSLVGRVAHLETISRHILDNQTVPDDLLQAAILQPVGSSHSNWLVEKALLHLITHQKHLTYQLDELTQEKQQAVANHLKQLRQHANFQNTLSHEFKSSIERVEAGIQLLKNQYISTEQEEAVELIYQGAKDLNAKLNQIIQLNRIEKGQVAIERHQFNPMRLIEEISESFQPIAHERLLKLTTKFYHADYTLEGDVQKISIILQSLIENALQFTNVGEIEIISQLNHLERHIRWSVQIKDTGIGIAKSHLKQLFEPFFQVSLTTRHSQNPQTVSLFLVKKLVDILGGSIDVTSQPDQGSVFTLHLDLQDWKDQYQRDLLKNKTLSFWGVDASFETLYQRSLEMGAIAQVFDDKAMLMDYVFTHHIDLLLISPTVEVTNVFNFIQHLRDNEQSHRLLVVYYHYPSQLSPQQLEELSIEGVDYFERYDEHHWELEQAIKRLIAYLN